MTFWQGFVIQIMGSLGMVNEKAALQIQNLLICIEMLIASLAHFYIFPYHEWQEGYKREKEKNILLRDTLALRDFVRDMRMMVTTWDPTPDAEQIALEENNENNEKLNIDVEANYQNHGNNGNIENGSDDGWRGVEEYMGNGGGDNMNRGGKVTGNESGRGRESSDHIGITMIDMLPINPSRSKTETVHSSYVDTEHSNRRQFSGYPTSTTTSFLTSSSDPAKHSLKNSNMNSNAYTKQETKNSFEYLNPLHFPQIPSMSCLSTHSAHSTHSYTSIPDNDEGTWTESLELKGSEKSRVLAAAIGSIDKNILELKGLGFDVGLDVDDEKQGERGKKSNFSQYRDDKVNKMPRSGGNERLRGKGVRQDKVDGKVNERGNENIREKRRENWRSAGVGTEEGEEMVLTSSGSSRSDIELSLNSNSADNMDHNTQNTNTWQSRLSLDKLSINSSSNNNKNENNNIENDDDSNNNNNNDNSTNNNNHDISKNNNNGPQAIQIQLPSYGIKDGSVAILKKKPWCSSGSKKSESSKRESYSSYEGAESDDDDDDEDQEDQESSSNSERDDDNDDIFQNTNTSTNTNTKAKRKKVFMDVGDGTPTGTSKQTAYFPFNSFTPSQPPILNSISTAPSPFQPPILNSISTAPSPSQPPILDSISTAPSPYQPPILNSISTETESSWRTADDEARTHTQEHLVSELQPDSDSDLELDLESDTLLSAVSTAIARTALLPSPHLLDNVEKDRDEDKDKEGKGDRNDEKKGGEVIEESEQENNTQHEGVEIGIEGSGITGTKSSIVTPQRVSKATTSSPSSSSSAGTDGPRTNSESNVRTATAERTFEQQESVSGQRHSQKRPVVESRSGSVSGAGSEEGTGAVSGTGARAGSEEWTGTGAGAVSQAGARAGPGNGSVFGLEFLEEESV